MSTDSGSPLACQRLVVPGSPPIRCTQALGHDGPCDEQVPWKFSRPEHPGQSRVAPRLCIANARDALNRAYAYDVAPWPLIAEAVDWQRRALEQMLVEDADA